MRKRDVILYLLLSKQGGLELEGSGTWSAQPFVAPTYAEAQQQIAVAESYRDVSEGGRFRARRDEGVNLAAPAVPVVPVFAAPTVDYLQIGQLAAKGGVASSGSVVAAEPPSGAVVTVAPPPGAKATVDEPPAFVAPTDPGLKLLAGDFPALNLVDLIGMSNVNEGG